MGKLWIFRTDFLNFFFDKLSYEALHMTWGNKNYRYRGLKLRIRSLILVNRAHDLLIRALVLVKLWSQFSEMREKIITVYCAQST